MTDKLPTQNMAIFCDFENVALGVEDAEYSAFDIQKVLERLLLKGNVVVKKAYRDWDRYKKFKTTLRDRCARPVVPEPSSSWSMVLGKLSTSM